MSNQIELSDTELNLLDEAAGYLESPTFLIRLANLVGKPIEGLVASLPNRAQQLIASTTSDAMQRACQWAISTIDPATIAQDSGSPPRDARSSMKRHTLLTALTGAGGGLLGLPGLALEIPATTTLMLRSIATIAASQGANLADPTTRLECVSVFSLGSKPLEDMDSAYFTARLSLAMAVNKASGFLAAHTAAEVADAMARGTAPVLVRFMNTVASRFQIVVTEKVAAQAIPLVGAALGAATNAAFTDHFNRVAWYHFGILAMERRHGHDVVRQAYHAACRRNRVGHSVVISGPEAA